MLPSETGKEEVPRSLAEKQHSPVLGRHCRGCPGLSRGRDQGVRLSGKDLAWVGWAEALAGGLHP